MADKQKYPLIEVLKTGTFEDAKGKKHTYDDARLDRMAAMYNAHAKTLEAPIVVGHPKSDSPAFGWIGSAVRKGHSLLLQPSSVVPAFIDAVKNGYYKHVSVKHDENDMIQHLGFLGGVPPAIEGLESVCFNANDENLIEGPMVEYMAWQESSSFNTIGRLLGNFRDFIIEKFDLATADTVLPSYDIDRLKTIQPDPEEESLGVGASYSLSKGENDVDLQAALARITAQDLEIANLKQQNTEYSKKLTDAGTEITTLKTAAETQQKTAAAAAKTARSVEFAKFLDTNCKGRISPELREDTIATMEAKFQLEQGAEYSKADGVDSPLEAYQKKLKALPTMVEFNEKATPGSVTVQTSVEADPVAFAQKIVEYRKAQSDKGIEISCSEASQALRAGVTA